MVLAVSLARHQVYVNVFFPGSALRYVLATRSGGVQAKGRPHTRGTELALRVFDSALAK